MSLRKSVRARLSGKRIGAAKPNKRAQRATPASPSSATRAVLIVLACVGGLAMLLAAREPGAPAATQPASVIAAPVAAEPGTTPKRAPAAAKTGTSTATPDVRQAAATPGAGVLSGAVTIEGCLELADGAYRLKDASGADVPKSRSWKSGFITKRSAPIEIVATPAGVKLAAYTGTRVRVTGALIDREMRAQSLRRIAASCN